MRKRPSLSSRSSRSTERMGSVEEIDLNLTFHSVCGGCYQQHLPTVMGDGVSAWDGDELLCGGQTNREVQVIWSHLVFYG